MTPIVLIPFLIFAVFFAAKGIIRFSRYTSVRNVPLISCAEVATMAAANATCTVSGLAKPSSRALVAPFSGQTCVWYRTHVEESYASSDADDITNYRRTIKKERTQVPFYLADDTGSVLINAAVASMDGEHHSYRLHVNRAADVPPSFDLSDWRWEAETRSVIFTEWMMPIDEPLFVTGSGVSTGNGAVLDQSDDSRLLVSTRDHHKFLTQERKVSIVYAAISLACLAVTVVIYAAA